MLTRIRRLNESCEIQNTSKTKKTRTLLVALSLACLEMGLLSKAPVALYYFFVWNTKRMLYVIMYILKK